MIEVGIYFFSFSSQIPLKLISGKMVTNYSTLETFYANAPSESDKYLQREESVKRINSQTSIEEMQEIVVDKRRKWKTKEEVMDEFRT